MGERCPPFRMPPLTLAAQSTVDRTTPATDGDRLFEAIAKGDHDACAELYDEFAAGIYGQAVMVLGDGSEAMNVVNGVFLALFRNARNFNGDKRTAQAWAEVLTRARVLRIGASREYFASGSSDFTD